MADKKLTGKTNAVKAVPSKAEVKAKPAAVPAVAAKPATSRVTSAKHSTPAKGKTVEIPAVTVAAGKIAADPVDAQADISRIAYSYWVARGYQGGNQAEDWFRAETEFRRRTAAV